jgi:hypothetical protein
MSIQILVVLFLLLVALEVGRSFLHVSVDDAHLHVEVTVEQSTAAVAVSGGGINGTARPEGLELIVEVGTPIAIAS